MPNENVRTTVHPSFDPKRELAEQDGTELQVGAITTDLALIPLHERMLWLPTGVLQHNSRMDTSGCSSRTPVAVLKAKFTYFYHHGMLPELKEWLNKNGYVKDGKVIFDETYIEILSGTTPTGNSMKAPLEAIRQYGLIPELLPLEDWMTWEQYMDRKRVTQSMFNLGKEFFRRFTIQYEQVPAYKFQELRKVDWLVNAAYGWPVPVNGVYPKSEGSYNHAFATINPEIDALDSYPEYNPQTGMLEGTDFTKRLAKDYAFFDWGYTISLTKQTAIEAAEIQETVRQNLLKHGLFSFFTKWLSLFTQKVGGVTKSFWEQLLDLLYEAFNTVPPVEEIPPEVVMGPIGRRMQLYNIAKSCLGRDIAATQNELGCAEAVSYLLTTIRLPNFPRGGYLGTYTLWKWLQKNTTQVLDPLPGDIIISPTGTSVRGAKHGHVGIIGYHGIMSNNSMNGLWQQYYSEQSWEAYYNQKLGFPTYYFRV